ncbi:MAG: S-methyl-5'-thioadenosine phosphorylase [Alphaproteobacteria bacterium]|nr:S-methyl-5'-thioadenosine phosphorylase [Alphaproteobacteria bacterium]
MPDTQPGTPPGTPPVIAIIGGSGVYDIAGLKNAKWRTVSSPFGRPSDQLLFGELDGQKMVFLPRHGRGHVVPPSALNFRANIDVLKRAGATEIVSVSACGSLREELSPGTFVIVDQFVDRTFAREKSFFGPGLVAHVGLGHPICGRLGDHLAAAAVEAGISVKRGGTYLVMEGPQFSTQAESNLYRAWGCDVIGMTNMPEAKLAREAEMCYATVAMVTDYDCWHPDHDHVTVDAVIKVLLANADKARELVRRVVPRLGARRGACEKGCHTALEYAIITHPAKRNPAMAKKLSAVAGRVLGVGKKSQKKGQKNGKKKP